MFYHVNTHKAVTKVACCSKHLFSPQVIFNRQLRNFSFGKSGSGFFAIQKYQSSPLIIIHTALFNPMVECLSIRRDGNSKHSAL